MMDETEFIENLIENVKTQRCLYDKTHEFYYNRIVRQKVWKEVSAVCNKSEFDCKHRWKLLRERFIKEMKRIEVVTSNGMVFSEEWKFLQPLMFLKDHCIWSPDSLQDILAPSLPPKKKARTTTPNIDIEIEETEIKPDLDALTQKVNICDQIQSVSTCNQVLPRLEYEQTKVKDDLIPPPLENSKQKQDEYQHLCSHCSQKLTKMNNNQRIFAEKLINDVLFNGELNLLNFNTNITNLTPYQSVPIAKENNLK